MKNISLFTMIVIMIVAFCLTGISAFAGDNRCPLTGSAYTLEADDVSYELSGFECTFGPGCQADCDLWHGNFETGPLYHEILPFNCRQSGDITITVAGADIPCALNSDGNLECLTVNTADYHCVDLGDKTWCFPTDPQRLLFKLLAISQ